MQFFLTESARTIHHTMIHVATCGADRQACRASNATVTDETRYSRVLRSKALQSAARGAHCGSHSMHLRVIGGYCSPTTLGVVLAATVDIDINILSPKLIIIIVIVASHNIVLRRQD